jgi:hypothetical protein
MKSCQIALRVTPEPGVLDLEVVVRPPLAQGAAFESLLPRYRMRCLARYIVHTSVRTILRAKLVGSAGDTTPSALGMVNLLEELRSCFAAECAARAA